MVAKMREHLVSVGEMPQLTEQVGKDGKLYDTKKQTESNKKRAKKTKTSETTTTIVA